jgi:putative phosphoribosyl transferase
MPFQDREEGGRRLAALLEGYRAERPVVLGLARGGVPVAFEVARLLAAPLDVLVVRKLGAPGMEEYGVGAVAEDGEVFLDAEALRELGVQRPQLDAILQRERAELERRVGRYRGGRPPLPVASRTAILVDDGIATGGTARAALRSLRRRRPRRLVLAAPVVAREATADLRGEVDDLVYVEAPEDFVAVGLWYRDFGQTTDEEVVRYLERAAGRTAEPGDPWATEWIGEDDGDQP